VTDSPTPDRATNPPHLYDLYGRLEHDFGIDKARLKEIMDGHDNWGRLVHAVDYVTVLSLVVQCWPDEHTP